MKWGFSWLLKKACMVYGLILPADAINHAFKNHSLEQINQNVKKVVIQANIITTFVFFQSWLETLGSDKSNFLRHTCKSDNRGIKAYFFLCAYI